MIRRDLKQFISIDADCSLYDAVIRLHGNNIRQLAVIDAGSRDSLYLLTYKRILNFISVVVSSILIEYY